MNEYKIEKIDKEIINFFKRIYPGLARFSIFLVFFWFGLLKVIDASPASEMVLTLLDMTMPFLGPEMFLKGFGLFEMFIGTLFLIPKATRVAIFFLLIHLFTTMLPLLILPELTWTGAFIPTMEGQYIIKNILIIALAATIGARIHPIKL